MPSVVGEMTKGAVFDYIVAGLAVDIENATAETVTNTATDAVLVWDASASANRFILLSNLGLGGGGGGEVNTGSDLGGTAGTFKQKTGVDLEFRGISAGSTKITITENATDIDVDVAEANINHDALSNFVADEHILHAGVTLTAGVGLSGGGTISASRTFDLDLNSLTTDTIAAADFVPFHDDLDGPNKITFANFEGTLNHDNLTGFVSDEHVAHSGVTLTAGIGLSGGGTIAANRTFDLDLNSLTTDTIVAGDFVPFHDLSDGPNKITFANFEGTLDHDNLTGFVSDEHVPHGGVTLTAGIGLSGGGTIAANRTFDLDLNSLTTDTIAAADFVPFHDDLDGPNKVTFANFEGTLNHDNLASFVADEHVAHSGVTLTAGVGLSGGGTIAASRTFDLDINSLTTDTIADADFVPFHDDADGPNKILFSNFKAGVLTIPTIGDFTNAAHNHEDAAGGGTLDLTAAFGATVLPIANGGTANTTAGAAFSALSPLTTKGDVLTYTTTDARLAVGATDGMKLVVDSGESEGIKWKDDLVSGLVKIPFPNTDHEIEIGYFPEGVELDEVYSIVADGTDVTFTLFERARTAPFSGGTTIQAGIVADTSGTTTTSFTDDALAADTIMVLVITALNGTVTEMLIVWEGHKTE